MRTHIHHLPCPRASFDQVLTLCLSRRRRHPIHRSISIDIRGKNVPAGLPGLPRLLLVRPTMLSGGNWRRRDNDVMKAGSFFWTPPPPPKAPRTKGGGLLRSDDEWQIGIAAVTLIDLLWKKKVSLVWTKRDGERLDHPTRPL